MSRTSLAQQSRNEEGLGRPLPVKLSRIERFEGQPRRHFDDRTVEELADDIQENRQRQPVKVCKHSKKPGVFVLIGGERRWRAFGVIRDRTKTDPLIDCFIDTVNDERHHFREAFVDNLQREDLIPLDEAAAYQRLYDDSKALSHSAKVAEVAKVAKRSTSHVENYLLVNRLPESVKKLMDPRLKKEERLSITSAIEIASATRNATMRLELAREAIERDLGVAEVRMLVAIRTGKKGTELGRGLRRPSDGYKLFKTLVNRMLIGARRIEQELDIDELYEARDTEENDRQEDGETLEEIVSLLGTLLKKVREEDG